jgi:hypothetical protein
VKTRIPASERTSQELNALLTKGVADGDARAELRLFLEERRRTKVIPHAFGERPVLKLMYAAVIRAAARWRGIMSGEFEQRQLKALRTELNRAHAERFAPVVRAVASASSARLSGKART